MNILEESIDILIDRAQYFFTKRQNKRIKNMESDPDAYIAYDIKFNGV